MRILNDNGAVQAPKYVEAVSSSGTFTVLADLAAGEKVTIAGHDFAFVDADPEGDEVLLGADPNASRDALVAAINASTTAGVAGVVTATPHADPGKLTVSASEPGVAGDAITIAKTGAHLAVSGANLAGGVDGVDGVAVPTPTGCTRVALQNLGPNPVYVGTMTTNTNPSEGVCLPAAVGGVPSAPVTFDKGVGTTLYVAAATADQASPADVRWFAQYEG